MFRNTKERIILEDKILSELQKEGKIISEFDELKSLATEMENGISKEEMTEIEKVLDKHKLQLASINESFK
jgi:hypothetical protein